MTDSLPTVAGFRWSAVAAGIKKRGGLDLALLAADAPVSAAALFTTNRVQAAPVQLARTRVKSGRAQAILVNAGCANACTGKPGLDAATATTKSVAKALGISEELVLPASTGVIGVLLPTAKLTSHTAALVEGLDPSRAADFGQAILTTDRGPKNATRTLVLGGKTVTVLGLAKGAGMIHPDMATTLAFLVTDANISPTQLRTLLRGAVDRSFHEITVDGDTSTNDTIVCLASGASKHRTLSAAERGKLGNALAGVLADLAKKIVSDGEGAEHTVTFEVRGTRTDGDARIVARTIATSNLVKTALFGKDPNWGRIVAAAGRAGVAFDPERIEVHIGDALVVKRGIFAGGDAEAAAHAVMKTAEYVVRMKLGAGKGRAKYVTCDLGHGYVNVNADYRS